MRFLFSVLLALCLVPAPASAEDSSWKTDVIALYEDLLKLSLWEEEEFARLGLVNGPGGKWMAQANAVKERIPSEPASFLYTPSGDAVVFGDLITLARKMVLGRDTSDVRSAARTANEWAGAAICVKHPQICAVDEDEESTGCGWDSPPPRPQHCN